MGDNGHYDPLIHCGNTWYIGSDKVMEVMTSAGDAPGGYLPPWLPRLSSCIVIIKDYIVFMLLSAIVCGCVPFIRCVSVHMWL